MWPYSSFAAPVSSFQSPVPIPGTDPLTGKCVQVSINEKWLPYVIGALKQLTLQTTWQYSTLDELNTVQSQAVAILSAFMNAIPGDCDNRPCGPGEPTFDIGDDVTQLRQQGCLLQAQCADGSWDTIYDPTNCITGGVSQPVPVGPLDFGECKTYDAVLQGNGKYLLPVPVSTGYTIRVIGAAGGWTDGNTSWFCPGGQAYALGTCSGFGTTDPADPLPSANHMDLIGALGLSPTYVDMFNLTYTVPSGITNQQFAFQANDSTLNDNAGSITFQVVVCNANIAPALYHDYDFTVAAYGWGADQTFVTQSPIPSWSAGNGFLAPLQDGGSTVPGAIWGFLYKDIAAFNLVSLEMTFSNSILSPGAISYVGSGHYPEGKNSRVTDPPTGVNTLIYTPPPLTSVTRLIAGISGNSPTVMYLTKLRVGYTGTPPIW
jgi:hypothetical protein